MRASLLACSVAFLCCSRDAAESQTRAADLSWVPIYFPLFDSVAAAAGLGPLRGESRADPELRLWHDRGLVPPHVLVRFREVDGRVEGQLFLWWPLLPEDPVWSAHIDSEVKDQYRCTRITDSLGIRACEVTDPAVGEWQILRDRLERYQVETLPDESQIDPPDQRMIVDGQTLVVEVRRAGRSRVYHYYAPGTRSWPEAQQARRIIVVLDELLDGARKPDR